MFSDLFCDGDLIKHSILLGVLSLEKKNNGVLDRKWNIHDKLLSVRLGIFASFKYSNKRLAL